MTYKIPKQNATSDKPDSSSESRNTFVETDDTAAVDHIQVLICLPGYVASKTFVKQENGAIDLRQYDLGWRVRHFQFPVSSIEGLSAALSALEESHRAIVIRGKAVDDLTVDGLVNRTGSGEGEQFIGNFMTPPEGRRWVLVDVDKCLLPKHLPLRQAKLPKILDWVIANLPAELHGVTCHWQLSSSAGVFGEDRLSIHLWFWLTEPVPNSVLKDWADNFNAGDSSVKIDTRLFQHVQAHYTAKPVFIGMDDPFPVRSGLLRKAHPAAAISSPIRKVQPPVRKRPKLPSHQKTQSVGFQSHLADIGDHQGGRGFRQALLSATASYVTAHGAEGTDPDDLYEILRDRVLEADASAHTVDEIEERASRETIMPMIKSALKKYGTDTRSATRKSKFYEGIEPHFSAHTTSVEAIKAELSNMLPSGGGFNENKGS